MSIRPFVEQNQDRLLQELAAYCAIPSLAMTGSQLQEGAAWVTERLEAIGASVTVVATEGAPVVYAELGPEDAARTLLIYNHYDVQPPDPLDAVGEPPLLPHRAGGPPVRARRRRQQGQLFEPRAGP